MIISLVNMIPRSLSGESNQDSEPNLAVDPENPQRIVGTAFTPDPLNGPRAPIFVSVDGGRTWSLRSIVPSGGPGTHDISVAFGSRGGTLYAGILSLQRDNHLNVLRTADPSSIAPMTLLVDRPSEDQPWASAMTAAGRDRVFIGHNDFSAVPRTASVISSRSARTAAAPSGFSSKTIERRTTVGQDGPPVRTAVHADGTVYAAFHRWVRPLGPEDLAVDIVVTRDDNWGGGASPFRALTDPDGIQGVRVATDRRVRFTGSVGPLGQERIGADLALAVDPTDSAKVWLAWCDRVGGATSTDWTMHVRHSTDRGRTWSGDVRTATNAKNPALAVSADGQAGLLFQQLGLTGAAARWVTALELSRDAWASPPTRSVLHIALASTPPRTFLPYLGDYIRLLSVGLDFYGIFSGSNLPDRLNFPSGVVYQRNANWTSHTLLRTDNATPVQLSIDPYFVRCTP